MKNEPLKIVVVGGVAGGASTAARIRRIDESAEIVMFERGAHISFSNCCLPYHINGMIPDIDNLIFFNPDSFMAEYKIEARVLQEVVAINRKEKTVDVKNHQTGEVYTESYDKLILAPGADALLPKSIKGIDKDHVFALKNVTDLQKITDYLKTKDTNLPICVCGAGFIGLETTEVLTQAGYQVHLVEAQDQVMTNLDKELVQLLHKALYDNGVQVHLNQSLVEIKDDAIVLASGESYPCQAVIMAVGVKPAVDFIREAGIEIGETGGIKVNQQYATNDPDIYAVGDAVEVYHRLSRQPANLFMAGPAQRQARAAADAIYGIPHNHQGVIGSSCLRLFNWNVASTGLNAKQCEALNLPYGYAYTIPFDSVSIMPDSKPLFFKLIYEYPTGRILGAQAVSEGDASKRVDVIAALISKNGILEDLKELELCYAPPYGTAKDVVNQTALVALNLLYNRYQQVGVDTVRDLVASGAYILDVRVQAQRDRGHIKNSVHIPLAQLRDRLDEIPKDRPIYVHCRSSQLSYFALRILVQSGFHEVYNISGSFLGLSAYEYFTDKITGREPIVTDYNFA